MSSSLPEEFRLSSLTLNYPEQTCFHRSQWNLPSWAYPAWRLFWCVWHTAWLVVSGVRTQNTAPDDEDGVKWFVYMSNWTFLLTTVFCLVDFGVVIRAACQQSREDKQTDHPEASAATDKEEILFQGEFTLVEGPSTSCLTKLQWSLFEAVNCTNLLSTIVFWASQYQDGEYIHPDIVVFNIINTLFVMANTLVTGIPIRILHFVYPAAFIAFYFLFNLIYYLADGTSITGSDVTFQPLQWDEAYPTAVTFVAGFLLAIPLGHLVFFSLYTLRLYLSDRFGQDPNSGSFPSVVSGHYRKRNSGVNIEAQSQDGQDKRFEHSARENPGFEMETDVRR